MERTGVVTLMGNPVTLVGPAVGVGDKAPDFTVVDAGLAPVTLADIGPGAKLISVVPSLDTPVCEAQTRRFNEEAAKIPGVAFATISVDLPFAQARFCATHGIETLKTLSDYNGHSFGQAYGVLIKEVKLVARAVFVIDKAGVVTYAEVVPEATNHPDYESALAAARALA